MNIEKVQTTTLVDGLRIVTQKSDFNTVFIGAWVKVGLVDEVESQNGLSHFLEHMIFKGTKTKTAIELSDYIERLGGECNAYTSAEETVIHTTLLPEYWRFGVDFLADVIQNSIFPEEELEKERNVILQEISMYENDPNSELHKHAMANMYESDPLGRTILGPRENIENFTREDLVNYYNAHYGPNNIVISACGNINHDEFVEYVKSQFMPNFREPTVPQLHCNTFKSGKHEVQNIFSQAQFLLSVQGPTCKGIEYKEKATLKLLFNVIDGGMSCRLFQEIREKHGLAYYVSLLSSRLESTGFFSVYAALDKKDVEKAIELTKQVLQSAKETITEEELLKAKNSVIHELAKYYDSCAGLATANGELTIHGLPYTTYEESKCVIQSITLTEVLECANKYIPNADEDSFALTIMTPYESAEEEDE